MPIITIMATNLLLELDARGIRSLGHADCEAIISAVVTNTANAAKAVEAVIARRTVAETAGQQ